MPTTTARSTPVVRPLIPNSPSIAPAISLLWEMFPIPKQAKPATSENSTASHFMPRPFSM